MVITDHNNKRVDNAEHVFEVKDATDSEYIDIIREACEERTSYKKRLSVKDLTQCQRRRVFSVKDRVPMADDDMFRYISGQAQHVVIENLLAAFSTRFRLEVEVIYKNITGVMDAYDKQRDVVLEIKPTNSFQQIEKPYSFHEKQLMYYMAMKGCENGKLIYLQNQFNQPKVFSYKLDDDQRLTILQQLEKAAYELQHAIEKEEPALVGGIYDIPDMKFMCKKCPYLNECNNINSKSSTPIMRS